MNKNSLANPVAHATGISIALAAALVAALAAFFVFSAKDAGAQSTSIKVQPQNVALGDVGVSSTSAVVSTEESEITIKNNGATAVSIGKVNVQGDNLDLLKLVDTGTGQEFLVNTATGLLQTLNPLTGLLEDATVDVAESGERVLKLVFSPEQPGDINSTVQLLNGTTNEVLRTVTVTGEGRQCTIQGTEGDDRGATAVRDTAASDEVICGLGGNDEIIATSGGDDVTLGGPGNDDINTRDNTKKEFVNGGSGQDLCLTNKDKVKSCGKKENKRK